MVRMGSWGGANRRRKLALTPGYVNYAVSVRISGDVAALCALQHLNLYVLCFSPDTSPHPISHEELRAAFNPSDGMECRHHRTGPHSDELPRRRCTGWFATINPDNLSQCAAPSVDPSKRLDVPGEYWRPRRKPRAQELKTRTHADPSCVSRIAARP